MIQLNFLLVAYLAAFLLRSIFQVFLDMLNISHLRRHGQAVPEEFRGEIDPEKMQTIFSYTIDTARLARLETLVSQGLFLFMLLSGLFPGVARTIEGWGWGPVSGGLVFFAFLAMLHHLIAIPFHLYANFVIEARYGFNTKTLRIWITDLWKGLSLSAILGGVLLVLLLFLTIHGGHLWWVWAWLLGGAVELLILWLYPILIAPLFNTFEPLENRELAERIAALLEKAGLSPKGIYRMDASRRSRHTNAYFTGFGRSKRIVLFDTLLASHTADEILAILAHEIGHWKKKHLLRQLVWVELGSLAAFYLAARCLEWDLLYRTFGFEQNLPYAGLFLAAVVFSPAGFFLQPLAAARSRHFEREADEFVRSLLPSPAPMIAALKRLAADNLANLSPHPLVAWFYYSHPPILQRIRRLHGEGGENDGKPRTIDMQG